MHLISGEANTVPVTITASVDLDAQPVLIGLVPRGSNPLLWDTAGWIGTIGTVRTAELAVGPLETIDPDPDIYDVWCRVDAGPPFLATGEVIFT